MPLRSSSAPPFDPEGGWDNLFSENPDIVQAALAQPARGVLADQSRTDSLTPLGWAIQHHRPDVVRVLLRTGADPNATQPARGRTAKISVLIMAIQEQQEEICNILLEAGATADGPALIEAIKKGQAKLVQQLLVRGAPVNALDAQNETALMVACDLRRKNTNSEAIVRELLDHGANPHTSRPTGRTPLIAAIQRKATGVVKTLVLDHRVDVHASDSSGRSPLFMAVTFGNQAICNFLLKHGSGQQINQIQKRSGGTILGLAAEMGKASLCSLLLKAGADVDHAADRGATPLCLAVARGHQAVVRVLLQAGANPNGHQPDHARPLEVAIKHRNENSGDIVRLLLGAGADVHAVMRDPQWPSEHDKDLLGFAIRLARGDDTGIEEIVRILLESGARPSGRPAGSQASTALMSAARRSEQLINLLVTAGSDMEETEQGGCTALHIAVLSRNDRTIRRLLDLGASTRCRNKSGKTPLHLVAGHADEDSYAAEWCRLLLKHGAEVDSVDDQQMTPLGAAVRNGNAEVCRVLLEYGAHPREAIRWARTDDEEIVLEASREQLRNAYALVQAAAEREILQECVDQLEAAEQPSLQMAATHRQRKL